MYDIGVDGGEQEGDGDMAAETEEVPYECPPRQKYPMLFDDPILLQVLLNAATYTTLYWLERNIFGLKWSFRQMHKMNNCWQIIVYMK